MVLNGTPYALCNCLRSKPCWPIFRSDKLSIWTRFSAESVEGGVYEDHLYICCSGFGQHTVILHRIENDSVMSHRSSPTVERIRQSPMWPLPILVIVLIAAVMYWAPLYEFVAKQTTSGGHTETQRADEKSAQERTYKERQTTPASMTERAVPASMMEQPQTPSSIGAESPSSTSKPASSAAEINLQSAVEAISIDGIYIEKLQESDDALTIIGYADDNKTIANYLRQLQQRIGNPLLNMTKREEQNGKMVSKFSIRLRK